MFFTLSVTIMVTGGKLLQEYGMHAVEVAFARNAIAAFFIIIFLLYKRDKSLVKTAHFKSHMSRSIMGNLSLVVAFWAFSLMPMADVVAIGFTSPLFVLILSIVFLKEKVGLWRWGAVGVGFIAVSLIVQPALSLGNSVGAGVALLSSFLIACVSINLRHLGKLNENPLTTSFYFLTSGTVFCGLALPFIWSETMLDIRLYHFVGLTALAGLISQIVKSEAYRHAEASLLSPFNYLNMLWATAIGWLIWADMPDIFVLLGCALLIVSNGVVMWRESKR